MSLHRHQSSLEDALNFSELFLLTPQQHQTARSLLNALTEHYGPEQTSQKGYLPATLIRSTFNYVASKDSFLAFFFTYLYECLTNVNSDIALAVSYFNDFASWDAVMQGKVMGAVEEFADFMVTQFFLPLRASSVKTPQPTPTSLSAIQPSTPTGTKQRISLLRHDCLIRDHHRCVVTRKFDIAEARKRRAKDKNCEDDDGKRLDSEPHDNFVHLEVAHIIPHCLMAVAPGDSELSDSKKNVLRILDMFDPGITHLIDGPKIDSPLNALTLTLECHRLFGEFQIYFEPTGKPYEYSIDSTESGFLRDPFFPVTRTLMLSPHRTIDPPSPRLLGVHRAIAHILKLSGAGDYIEQILRMEQVAVEADGSTNLGDIMRLRFDSWLSQLAVF
ncbi:HNH endonuclease signature motif containing protein [Aspergillus clavatus NRRL 1]|uniref:HNH nuclease domain-containing protein n=1 Tax=Aspergillus clavatus (strain ATCC 1007 / CBS 513.65 / DSM 816 / NCTC 3887 / NRRL 1 / QM 1276 / 107) TaxID=344612 RepID=A1C9E9_ASPCL|nr:uncharacterized protein ACLA_055200 [Aspergillus clavatus NRRL 1]EAW13473.1 conserved hypothetical protein [Aspergillus clavatus NRRL 1]